MKPLNADFWESRYQQGDTGWDLGQPSPPIANFIDQLKNPEIKILIPGGGNSYEAEYLFAKGFKNVFVIDLAESPLQNLKQRIPLFPDDHLIVGNFFDHQQQYDLILEQTFFCAIDPALRSEYVKKMHELLKLAGILAGLLFDCEFDKEGPPFPGSREEYVPLFSPYFELLQFDKAPNSILPRKDRELFIECRKK